MKKARQLTKRLKNSFTFGQNKNITQIKKSKTQS